MVALLITGFLLILAAFNGGCHSLPVESLASTTDFAIVSSLSNVNDFRKLYKVYANGTLEQIDLQIERDISFTSGEGSTASLTAFNNSLIAFIKNNNLWLYELDTKESQQITLVGRPQDSIFAAINIFITGWSLNNQKLLYHVSPGETSCADCDKSWNKREADYGHYIYDLSTKDHRKVELPGKYSGWIFDESILVRKRSPQVISIYSPSTNSTSSLGTLEYEINQPNISLDGTWMAAAFLDWTNSRTQIIKMNLRTGDFIPITDFASWGEYQNPTLSPNAKSISHYQPIRNLEKRRIEKYNLIVNENPIYECEFRPRARWINEEIIAIHCLYEITVMNVQSKEIIAHHMP